MATTQSTQNVTLIAGEDLAGAIFAKADTAAARTVVLADDGTGVQFVTAGAFLSGEPIPLIIASGAIAKITLGETLGIGVPVMPGTAGKAVAAAGVDAIWAGYLIEGGDADEVVEMIFSPLRGVSA